MWHLNEKWENFRIAVVTVSSSLAAIGTGIWAFSYAEHVRGYQAVGSEYMLTIGAAVLVGIIAHKILNKVEGNLNDHIEAENEARRQEAIRQACKARMYTVGEEPKQQHLPKFNMFSVGD